MDDFGYQEEDYEYPVSMAPAILESAHQSIHDEEFPHDFDDTLLLALTRKDILTLGMALILLDLAYPCLREVNVDLQNRICELRKAQKPEWTDGA